MFKRIISHESTSVELEKTISFGHKEVETYIFDTGDDEDNEWIAKSIISETNRHMDKYWFLYTLIPFCGVTLIDYIRKGNGVWKSIFKSDIIFAILLIIYGERSYIQQLITI